MCTVKHSVSHQALCTLYHTPVVLNLFYISYPFIKQDYQIYLQYTQWCSFSENTKLANYYRLE